MERKSSTEQGGVVLPPGLSKILSWRIAALFTFGTYVLVLAVPPSCLGGICSFIFVLIISFAAPITLASMFGDDGNGGSAEMHKVGGPGSKNNDDDVLGAAWIGNVIIFIAALFLFYVRLIHLNFSSDGVAFIAYVLDVIYCFASIILFTQSLEESS